ncbi:MAG: hypothetical protein CK425_06870 [Parachlamydia sp.]|nr:MAG: hypothetical protein CK425_06870 [Parachlamydia sp.]
MIKMADIFAKFLGHMSMCVCSKIAHLSHPSDFRKKTVEAFDVFWRHHPALLYALFALIGIHVALSYSILTLIPLTILGLPFFLSSLYSFRQLKIRLLCGLAISCGFYAYVAAAYVYPKIEVQGVSGIACIDISALRQVNGYHGKNWKYAGTLLHFTPKSAKGDAISIARNVPYTLFLPGSAETHPPASGAYYVEAVLKEWRSGYYILNVKKGGQWIPIPHSWSLAEWRFQLKRKAVAAIHASIPNERSAHFLAGIVTGEFDDELLSFEFSRFGLQHIMAISGFHFGIIASILGFFLQQGFSQKNQAILLLIFLTLYFLFLGPACSIMRAWITISIYLLGHLLGKRTFGLNSLGIALLILLFFNPLSYRSLAFQFSVLTTAGILLFVPLSLNFLEKIWRKRPLQAVIKMPLLDQHGYTLLSIFRHGIALCLAVNVCAFPLTLYHFHKFPLMSLVYNLFFPFLVSVAVFLLIAAICVGMICPYLGDWIHALNSEFSAWMLDFTFNMPTTVDFFYRVSSMSGLSLVCYLTLLFSGGILLTNSMRQAKSSIDYLT